MSLSLTPVVQVLLIIGACCVIVLCLTVMIILIIRHSNKYKTNRFLDEAVGVVEIQDETIMSTTNYNNKPFSLAPSKIKSSSSNGTLFSSFAVAPISPTEPFRIDSIDSELTNNSSHFHSDPTNPPTIPLPDFPPNTVSRNPFTNPNYDPSVFVSDICSSSSSIIFSDPVTSSFAMTKSFGTLSSPTSSISSSILATPFKLTEIAQTTPSPVRLNPLPAIYQKAKIHDDSDFNFGMSPTNHSLTSLKFITATSEDGSPRRHTISAPITMRGRAQRRPGIEGFPTFPSPFRNTKLASIFGDSELHDLESDPNRPRIYTSQLFGKSTMSSAENARIGTKYDSALDLLSIYIDMDDDFTNHDKAWKLV